MIYKAIIFLPFLSFLILGINVILRSATTRGSRKTNNILLYLSTAIIGISLILSCYGLYSLDTPITVHLANWIKVAGIKANFNLYIDKLSLMLVILTSLISFLVHIYSISYMNADKSKVKFFAYLDLFTFYSLIYTLT